MHSMDIGQLKNNTNSNLLVYFRGYILRAVVLLQLFFTDVHLGCIRDVAFYHIRNIGLCCKSDIIVKL